jgi:hypothetical protein
LKLPHRALATKGRELKVIPHPFIYEINTWPWLTELGVRYDRPIDLGDVPDEVWDGVADSGFDAVWLMGVWQRSPEGIAIATADSALMQTCRDILPDFTFDDVAGSPYCIRDYEVDPFLGGPEGLAAARRALADRGLRLILDFVPNHVAPDHPWTTAHPEYFVGGSADDLRADPASFIDIEGRVLASGRDPYFPAWLDVVQLNAFSAELRAAVISTLRRIAEQCDGVRCDMAMLMMNDIFVLTWGERVGAIPEQDYWTLVIDAVRAVHPDFTFIAEAYWDLELSLQEQGFDYCYDKNLYDRFADGSSATDVGTHLDADPDYQTRLVRFLENHDEPRAASVFTPQHQKLAAVAAFTQAGARLIYDGQLEGRRIHVPVQLGRAPTETADDELVEFYRRLLITLRDNTFRNGIWTRCDISGWENNPSTANLLAWAWDGETRWLIVVNLSDDVSDGMVRAPWNDLDADEVDLVDDTRDLRLRRSVADLQDGLYVELGPRLWHLFRVDPTLSDISPDSVDPEEN